MIDPGTALLASTALSSGLNALGGIFGGGQSDTSKSDTRWMNDFAWKQSLRNEEFQKNLALNGIQIRMADAKAAGIHPLAALGGMPSGGSPSTAAFVGSNTGGSGRNLYSALGTMGQDLTRAYAAQASSDDRALMASNIRKVDAEADYATAMAEESRWRRMGGGNPPAPSPYGGAMTADVGVTPYGHQWIRGPNGPVMEWSEDRSRALQGRPISSFIRDAGDLLTIDVPGYIKNWYRKAKDYISR